MRELLFGDTVTLRDGADAALCAQLTGPPLVNGFFAGDLYERLGYSGTTASEESKTPTRIAYKSIYINQPVAEALFTFVPPPNAKEVDNFSMPESPSRGLQDKPAPEFSLTTVEGKNTSLTDFKGKTILLDFWATWCLPCRESTPVIEKLQSAFSKKG